MPQRLAKYLTQVYAALIVLVIIVASFMYSVLKADPVELDDITIEVDDTGAYYVNPGEGSVPSSPPEFIEPLSPPPGQ